jgi:hypothetical protein
LEDIQEGLGSACGSHKRHDAPLPRSPVTFQGSNRFFTAQFEKWLIPHLHTGEKLYLGDQRFPGFPIFDQFDVAQSEVITSSPGLTVPGLKIFKTVTSATKGAVGSQPDTASIGTSWSCLDDHWFD